MKRARMRQGLPILWFLLTPVLLAWGEEPLTAAQVLLAEGDRVFRTREYAQATVLYEKAAVQAEKDRETSTLVEALSMAARGYLIREKGAAGRPFLERATTLARDTDAQGWSRYLGVRGRFEWKQGDKPRATKTFEAMYDYCWKRELWRRAVDAAHMVAIVGTSAEQLVWAQKGIAAAEKGEMDGWLGPLWNNLGNTYDELKRPKEALEAWIKARHYHWKVGSETNKLIADWAVGLGHRKVGDLQRALQWQRPVLAWAERRLAEKDEPERREWVALAQMQLGLIALAQKRPREACALLAPAYKVLETAGMKKWHPAAWAELEAAQWVANAHTMMSNLGSAINSYRLMNKKLPESLQALTETDSRNPMPFLTSIPPDSWGNPYDYRVLDRKSYQIVSAGPDGQLDSEDDLLFPPPK